MDIQEVGIALRTVAGEVEQDVPPVLGKVGPEVAESSPRFVKIAEEAGEMAVKLAAMARTLEEELVPETGSLAEKTTGEAQALGAVNEPLDDGISTVFSLNRGERSTEGVAEDVALIAATGNAWDAAKERTELSAQGLTEIADGTETGGSKMRAVQASLAASVALLREVEESFRVFGNATTSISEEVGVANSETVAGVESAQQVAEMKIGTA